MTGEPQLVVLQPGLLTTVQDLGRSGLAQFGVTPGGAADRSAAILGNRLLGNDPGAATLECTLAGPRLQFPQGAIVALTGADLGWTLDGLVAPCWQPLAIAPGGTLAVAPMPVGAGVRGYVCVAGGIAVPEVLGSRSTALVGAFGGHEGRALRTGDALPLGPAPADPVAILRRRLAGPPPVIADGAATVRVTAGPQASRFTLAGLAAFLGGTYVVSARSDRQGVRLQGPEIAHRVGPDIVSEGITRGAVQVPGDGQPIVLLGARQTVGGYTKIATVIGADIDLLAQRRPGDRLRFVEVSVAAARVATRAALLALGPESIRT